MKEVERTLGSVDEVDEVISTEVLTALSRRRCSSGMPGNATWSIVPGYCIFCLLWKTLDGSQTRAGNPSMRCHEQTAPPPEEEASMMRLAFLTQPGRHFQQSRPTSHGRTQGRQRIAGLNPGAGRVDDVPGSKDAGRRRRDHL